MGHASRDAGKEFEARIDNALAVGMQTGVVVWYAHQQPTVTMFGKRIAKSGADYVLALAGGTAGAIECKSAVPKKNDAHRIGLDAFTGKQKDHLDATARSGGLALAALEYRDPRSGVVRAFIVPWQLVPWKKLTSRHVVELEDIDARWTMPTTGTIAAYVKKCVGCARYYPAHAPFAACCSGGPPF